MRPKKSDSGISERRRAVIYCRVSSMEQEKGGFSIPAQRKLLMDYARSFGLEVIKEFVDVETAKQSGRTKFGEMVSLLQGQGGQIALLVEKTDRLYRNFRDWVTVDDLDVEVHLVKEHVVLSEDSDSNAQFQHGINVLMAKRFIDNLKEETRKGLREKARQGYYPSVAPFGYVNVPGANGKKTIAPDPKAAPLIRRLFEWYASGNYSLKEVTKMAKAEGLRSRKGRPVNKSMIHKALRNRVYSGEFVWKGETYQGNYEPMVSRELWEQVQAVLEDRFSKRNRKSKHNFAFSGLVRCGHCGCSLVGEIQKRKYVYYHCSGFKGKCPEPYTREEVFEDLFAGLVRQLEFDEETLAWVRSALKMSHSEEKRAHEEAITRLQEQYNRLQKRIEAAYDDKLDGRIEAEMFDRRSAEWRLEQEEVTRALQRHQAANQNYLEEGSMLLELASNAYSLFTRQRPLEKRRLLDFLLSNCTWKNGELVAEFRQPFDMLAKTNVAYKEKTASGEISEDRFAFYLPKVGLLPTVLR